MEGAGGGRGLGQWGQVHGLHTVRSYDAGDFHYRVVIQVGDGAAIRQVKRGKVLLPAGQHVSRYLQAHPAQSALGNKSTHGLIITDAGDNLRPGTGISAAKPLIHWIGFQACALFSGLVNAPDIVAYMIVRR